MSTRNDYNKKYWIKNKELLKIKKRDFYFKNREKILEGKKKHIERDKQTAIRYRKRHREKIRQESAGYRLTLEGRHTQWKRSAKTREIEWDLSLEFLKSLPMTCFYTKKPLTFQPNCKNTVSLDRLDSSIGYKKDNVVLCCACVNLSKNSLSRLEFIELCGEVWNNK